MSWWGKVVGGALGFMLGGPLGSLLGLAIGGAIDDRIIDIGKLGDQGFFPGQQERTQAAFFAATFSVMGHIARADGRVSADEISIAEAVIKEMRLDAQHRAVAIALFNQGKQPNFDLNAALRQFRAECHRRTTLLQVFLEIQAQAAFADNRLHPAERQILEKIAASLGFSRPDLERIINAARPTTELGSDPYSVLGVTRQTPMTEIKKTYRRLLSQHHPDKLVSKGMPEEMIRFANQKTHEIRAAWKAIQNERG